MIRVPQDLRPGDLLLYRSGGLFAWAIRVKTWSDVNHVETYVGTSQAFSARNNGVNVFPLRLEGLRYVLRPIAPYDHVAAAAWRETVRGQRYDWKGMLVFFLAAAQSARDRQFCSEACTRDARAGKIVPFADTFDADRVAPGSFLASPAYRREAWEVA